MGLLLDTSVLIARERLGGSVHQLLGRVLDFFGGGTEVAIFVVTVVELTHGIYRARIEKDCEQAPLGNVLPFEDLLIGATALSLGFAVATLNVRHFQRVPDLLVLTI